MTAVPRGVGDPRVTRGPAAIALQGAFELGGGVGRGDLGVVAPAVSLDRCVPADRGAIRGIASGPGGPAPELGRFLMADPCELTEITRRFGAGDYGVTAYQIDPADLLWEVIATGVRAAP